MSHPDFSMGIADVQSASGPGTASGTDSVRPMSRPGLKLSSVKRDMRTSVAVRPVTVGGSKGRLFRRSDYSKVRSGATMAGTGNPNM